MLVYILLAIATLFLIYNLIKPQIPDKFPPGPKTYPLLGSLPSLGQFKEKLFHRILFQMGKDYGPVSGLFLGRKTKCAVINGYETVKEVLLREEFIARPKIFRIDKNEQITWKIGGIMFANAECWREQRRFTLRHLRDFGFGKNSQESVIHEEIGELISRLKTKLDVSSDKVIPLHDIFAIPIINILWAVVAGKRYDHDDPKFLYIISKINESFRAGNDSSNIFNEYPFLRHLPYFNKKWKTFTSGQIASITLLEQSLKEHKISRIRGSPGDFIDQYLDEMDELKDKNELSKTHFSETQLTYLCSDLFAAGSESTSNSLSIALLYMSLYPKVQEKIHQEIDIVVGKDRLPSINDKSKMPFTEAVTMELLRMANIAPLTVPHACDKDTYLNGFFLPKDCFLMVNLYSVHMDKEYWGDPEVFRPERFLNDRGEVIKNERLMPFGLGKRICPGEILARMNYFLFFTSFLQQFRVEIPPGANRPDEIPLEGFTLAPKPFSSKILCRF